jgi:hypothetical protein
MSLTDTPGIYFSVGISAVKTLLKAPATASQPFTQWASARTSDSSPTLGETLSWIKSKLEAKAGGVFPDTSHVLDPNEISQQEMSSTQLLPSDDECVLKRKFRRTIRTRWANSESGCQEMSVDDYLEVLPIAYLKEAKLFVSQDGVPSVDLKFDGNKHLVHSEGSSTRYGCKDSSMNVNSTSKPFDFRSDFDLIDFFRDRTEDNEALAKRVADAFNHAAQLCAAKRPKSNEPF